ncbi:MAG: hypothetical protein MR008_04835 [Aerococcus sp.]|nr:hypothetical protein [Aerococcus sp.]
MQINLYDYLEKKMSKDIWQSEWRIIEDERVEEITIQLFLPLKDVLAEAELADFEQHTVDASSSYMLQAQFNPVVTGDANVDGYYYFAPQMYDGEFMKTNIDIILEALHQLEVSAVSQLRDMAKGERESLYLPWPTNFETSRIDTLKSAGRFEAIPVRRNH